MAELNYNHVAQQSVTVAGIPKSLTLPIRQLNNLGIPATDASGRALNIIPRHALIKVMGQPIRWRADGSTPDGAPGMGMHQDAGSFISWLDPLGDFSALIQRVQFVLAEGAPAGTSATLEVSFFN